MGRGGYLGGGTIIKAGSDWFSGRGKRPPRTVETSCSPEALAFLKRVIGTRRIVPEVPKDMSPELAKEIARFGGPFEWARTRKEYSSLQRRSAPKSGRAAAKPNVGTRREMELLSHAKVALPSSSSGTLLAEYNEPLPPRPVRRPNPTSTANRPSLTEQARVTYLTALIAGMVRNGPLPRPPRNEPGQWAMDAFAGGSLEEWARAQAEFGAIEAKMRKRVDRQARK